MFCAECGQEILNRSRFCPVCGADVKHGAVSSSDITKVYYIPRIVKNNILNSAICRKILKLAGKLRASLSLPDQRQEDQRNNLFFYSGVGLLIVSMTQFISFNPLLTSGFSAWYHYAYMRGIPLPICHILPYAMVVCDLFAIIAGVAGVSLASRGGAAKYYKFLGIVTAAASSGMLAMRIIHRHVIFSSVDMFSTETMLPETIVKLREQYSRSLYPLFIFAAMSALLSFFYIYGSARFGKLSKFNAGKAMAAAGIPGLTVSLYGAFFGQNAGKRVPMVAAWAAVAFGVMLVSGIAGLSKRRRPSTRAIWGFAQLAVFTLCILQTIYYAYSAMVQGALFYTGSLIWITVLSGVLAVSTILSALNMTCHS